MGLYDPVLIIRSRTADESPLIGDKMKRKPKEKLSDRLVKHFLLRVKKYNYHYFDMLTSTTKACVDYTPRDLAKELTRQVMGMIAEYEPEDIE